MDLESGLFRMLDEALAGYLGVIPDKVVVRLDWADGLTADVIATRAVGRAGPGAATSRSRPRTAGKDLPPALAALVEERRVPRSATPPRRAGASIVVLPARRGARSRTAPPRSASTAELRADGGQLHLWPNPPGWTDGAGDGRRRP